MFVNIDKLKLTIRKRKKTLVKNLYFFFKHLQNESREDKTLKKYS